MKSGISILILGLLFSVSAGADTPGEIKEGGYLPEAPMYGFAGDYRHLSELRGKPLIINVWASWCGPCRAEMGSLDRLARRYSGKQFNIVGVSTDDDANAAYAYLVQSGITFDNYLDFKLMFENMLGADMIPLTVLVDAQGRVLKKVHGSRQWDSQESLDLIGKTFGVSM